MLDKFRSAKQTEIKALAGAIPPLWTGKRPSFKGALSGHGLAVIAEYKLASPSRGTIRDDLSIGEAVASYATGGAAALSILTEEKYFHGHTDFLAQARQSVQLPLLRKDFIFHPLQIHATAATPASAILLIVRMLQRSELQELRELAASYGIDSVVEVFDEEDLAIARESEADIIQVNSRDLKTLAVNPSLHTELIKKAQPRPGEIWIAASGMSKPEDLLAVQKAGYNAALIGTALMLKPQPGAYLRQLLAGLERQDAG